MMLNNLPVIHALWIGSKLGNISRSCLRSFVMRGHEVHLHIYDHVEDVPEGITIVDANKIIPASKIFKHNKTGSYALFSDLFRYELLTKVDGVYVDCDVYCLKPITIPDSGYLLGFEDDKMINGAVLAMPKDCQLLKDLLTAAYDPYFVPPWYSSTKQTRLKLKKSFGLGKNLSDMPWGVIGPKAITYYTYHSNLQQMVQPIDIFYPVHYQCVVGHLCSTGLSVSDITTSRTRCIHLYNEMLKAVDFTALDPESIMYQLLENKI